MCVCNMKTIQQRFARYRPENELIIRHQLKTMIASKSRSQIRSKVITPKSTSKGCVYAILSNLANTFRDIV